MRTILIVERVTGEDCLRRFWWSSRCLLCYSSTFPVLVQFISKSLNVKLADTNRSLSNISRIWIFKLLQKQSNIVCFHRRPIDQNGWEIWKQTKCRSGKNFFVVLCLKIKLFIAICDWQKCTLSFSAQLTVRYLISSFLDNLYRRVAFTERCWNDIEIVTCRRVYRETEDSAQRRSFVEDDSSKSKSCAKEKLAEKS